MGNPDNDDLTYTEASDRSYFRGRIERARFEIQRFGIAFLFLAVTNIVASARFSAGHSTEVVTMAIAAVGILSLILTAIGWMKKLKVAASLRLEWRHRFGTEYAAESKSMSEGGLEFSPNRGRIVILTALGGILVTYPVGFVMAIRLERERAHVREVARTADDLRQRVFGPDFAQCVAAARALDRPYLVASAVVIGHLDRGLDSSVTLSVRIAYSLLLLRNVGEDETAFFEQYGGGTGNVRLWPGSNVEARTEHPGETRIRVAGRKDDYVTLVTAAEIRYERSDPPRTSLRTWRELLPTESAFEYPNGRGVVCSLQIFLDSESLPLVTAGNAAVRFFRNGGSPQSQAAHWSPNLAGPGGSLSARWSHLRPYERVALVYSWGER